MGLRNCVTGTEREDRWGKAGKGGGVRGGSGRNAGVGNQDEMQRSEEDKEEAKVGPCERSHAPVAMQIWTFYPFIIFK